MKRPAMTVEEAFRAGINATNDYGSGSPQAKKAWRAQDRNARAFAIKKAAAK